MKENLTPKELLTKMVKLTSISVIFVEPHFEMIDLERLNKNCQKFTILNAQSEYFTPKDDEFLKGLGVSDDKTDRWTAWLVDEWHKNEPFEILYRALTTSLIDYIDKQRLPAIKRR